MVRWPERDLCSETAMTSLISLMPARTALKATNSELVRRAMRRARVVLPHPGGPQKSMEPRLSFSICTRRDFPGPRSFSCPINSSSVRGRMRSASGWLAAGTSGSGAGGGNLEKRLTLFLDVRRGHRVSLACGFVKNDGCRGSGIQGFDAAGHGNPDARIGATLDFFGKTGALVADQECDRLAPIDFPRSKQRLFTVPRFMNARCQRANSCDLELREQNRKRHSGENRKMQSSASGSAQSFRREWIRGAANSGSGGGGAGRAKGGSGAQDRSHVSGILDACENDEQRSAGRTRGAHKIIEGSLPWMNQRRDALRMFSVGEALEEAVGGVQNRKSHLGPVDEGGEAFVMAFAGFAEEHGLNAAAGTKCLFDEPHTLDAHEAVFRGQAAAQSHAELLQPAIVAASEERRLACGVSLTSGIAGRCHYRGG